MNEERCPICDDDECDFTWCAGCDRNVCYNCVEETADGEELLCVECGDACVSEADRDEEADRA